MTNNRIDNFIDSVLAGLAARTDARYVADVLRDAPTSTDACATLLAEMASESGDPAPLRMAQVIRYNQQPAPAGDRREDAEGDVYARKDRKP